MREYTAKNKDRLNAERNARNKARLEAMSPEEREAYYENRRAITKASDDKHREAIRARHRANNWYFDSESAKEKRARHYSKCHAVNVLRPKKALAKKKGLAYDLTQEWYETEWDKGCTVTGEPFAEPRSGSPWTAHIDRIEADKGYVMDNCRLVCAMFNQAKGAWTDADVVTMAKAILRTTDA